MAWLKVSDRAATHPAVMELGEVDPDDPRLLNEALGWLLRCAIQAAAMATDGIVSKAVGRGFAGERTPVLAAACLEAGLLVEAETPTGKPAWRLLEDHELFHWKNADEVAFERQRRQDRANPELAIQVRARDGDACRYCGRVVRWGISRSGIAGTFDHREPGRAGTVDTVVVACSRCNGERGADPAADERLPLLDVPSEPYFRPESRRWINTHPWAISHGFEVAAPMGPPVRPGNVPPGHKGAENDRFAESDAKSTSSPTYSGAKSDLAQDKNMPLPAITADFDGDGVTDAAMPKPQIPTPGDLAAAKSGSKSSPKSDPSTHLTSTYGQPKSDLAQEENMPLPAETPPSNLDGVKRPNTLDGSGLGSRAGTGRGGGPGGHLPDEPADRPNHRRRRRSRGRRGRGTSTPSHTSGDNS